MHCAVCSLPVVRDDSTPYHVGAVQGCLCDGCQIGLAEQVTSWMARRMRELAATRRAEERHARRLIDESERSRKQLRDALFPELVRPARAAEVRRADAAE